MWGCCSLNNLLIVSLMWCALGGRQVYRARLGDVAVPFFQCWLCTFGLDHWIADTAVKLKAVKC